MAQDNKAPRESSDKYYQDQAKALVAQKYSVTKNCVELKTKLDNIAAEILTRTELQASSGCRNKLFGKDDCKQEQKNFLLILRAQELALNQAYNTNQCSLVFGKIDADITNAAIEQGYAQADEELGKGLRTQEYLIYGVGLLVVGFGIYYFIKKR
jgi:hypothetical protein